jgi:RHS repeat-associated protein
MTFTWEHGRQLASLQTDDNSVNYKYDSNGIRTQKSVDGTNTNYYYDSDKNLIGLTKGEDTLLFYYDSDGNVTSFKYNGTMYYYIKNLQGDIVKIIDQTGTEVAGYVYDAWGNIHSETGDSNLKSLNPFRYRGYVYDEETGLYYLQSRYYDPLSGRFLNADVYCDTCSGSPLSTNMFSYCENNAIMKYDVTGNDAWWIQSPNSAFGKGHTSLLIQEKSGYWWYFYWGPEAYN